MNQFRSKVTVLVALFFCLSQQNFAQNNLEVKQAQDQRGYTYQYVENDPTGLRLYTLDNGLKVYLSQNQDEPKIQTYIAVKAGSTYDPKESTGLAHYLEHMLFKGTHEFGTKDWPQEKVYLDSIYELYEAHRAETDSVKKEQLYREIDRISYKASEFAIANEYDKMVGSLGAQGTNAGTSNEYTVYMNKIPSNELKKFLKLEGDRFQTLVLRLFHTELEAVYEEFNGTQDSDPRKKRAAMYDALFPNHPYGQQTTIGVAEHLKNPSMRDINDYFNKYYVPNNMAVVLVGDLDFDRSIALVDQYFGKLKRQELVKPELPKEAPLDKIVEVEVFGPTAESVSLAYRIGSYGSREHKMTRLIDMILSNSEAGLIDLNLNQRQKVQSASSTVYYLNEYGVQSLNGVPKEGQSLDEVKGLLLGELDKIKKGDFEDWMIDAVINDMKLSRLKQYDNSSALAGIFYSSFIHEQEWSDYLSFLDELKQISKEELVDFANEFYKDNYVLVYKRQGEDPSVVKVKNPGITPVQVNREDQSDYLKDFISTPVEPLKPLFVDYEKEIQKTTLGIGMEMAYIVNEKNELFDLSIILDMGTDHMKELGLAVGYLDYLGTSEMSNEALKKEFYKLGISYGVNSGTKRSYVTLSGLQENLDQGLRLLEKLLTDAKADQEAYEKFVDRILKSRKDGMARKDNILWNGLWSYAKYGEGSRLRNIYSAEELKAMDPNRLVDLIKGLKAYPQRAFYFGNSPEQSAVVLNEVHALDDNKKSIPEPVVFKEVETGDQVLFVDFDMVQAELLLLAKADLFDPKLMAVSSVFNDYFGFNMNSIVFQELRESKSLAYTAFAGFSNGAEKDMHNYAFGYIQTQANKLPEAVVALKGLMDNMPEVESSFERSKESALKKIAAQRITKSSIFWNYESLKRRGIDYDIRKDIYKEIQAMKIEDMTGFFNDQIKGKAYTTLLMGKKEDLDLSNLENLGSLKELDIEYLFNYNSNDN